MIKRAGFTLIEVMVALLVLSIAVAAVLKAINTQILVSERVFNAQTSRWVAMNVIAKMQAGILPATPQAHEGEEVLFGKTWYWKTEPRETDNARVWQVNVSVGLKREELARSTLLGFVQSE